MRGIPRRNKKGPMYRAWEIGEVLREIGKAGRNAAGLLFLLVLLGFFDFLLLTVVALGHNMTPNKGLKKHKYIATRRCM